MPNGYPVATVDISALRDGRASAGIGRYVRGLLAGMAGVEGIELHRCSPLLAPHPDAWVTRFLNAQPAQGIAWLRRGRRSNAVLHVTSTDPSAIWPLEAQVVTVHDVEAWTGVQRSGLQHRITSRYFAWQRRRFRRCAALIAVSETTAAEAVDVFGVDRRRMHVVGEGVSPMFTDQDEGGDLDGKLRRAAGASTDGYIAWVGSLRVHDPRKALDVLLHALGTMAHRPKLVMVGQCGAESQRVERIAQERGIHLVSTGFVDDRTLAALYRGAGAVAVPSLHEGFGLPMLEAMACGAPVVASDVANMRELGRGGAALLVPPGDAPALASALESVLGDPGRAKQLRNAGRLRAGEHNWHSAATRTAEIYREVVAGRSR